MNIEDLEFVKPSRTRKRNPVAKAVRDPEFKMQVVESKKKRKDRFKDDYMDGELYD